MAVIDPATRVAELEAALAAGELRVESAGDSVTYRSVADLKAAIDYFKGQIPAAPSATSFGFSAVAFTRD